MTRKEAVLLVSRAIAMMQLSYAFVEVTTLTTWFVSLNHYTSRINASMALPSDYYFKSYDQIGIAFNFARIAILMIFAFLFWNCAPWVERILLPNREDQDKAA
jgi:glycerol-3-phosphate acyltransferase PlsY